MLNKTTSSTSLYILSAIGIWFVVSMIFLTIPQTKSNKIAENKEQFNTMVLQTGNKTLTGISYALPNGLILFDTATISTKDYDYDSDDSITKFVSRNITLNDVKYTPDDLVSISNTWLVLSKWSNMKLRAIAHTKLNDMAKEFYNIFWDKLVIVSAYRSYEYQRNLKKWCSDTLCALPGRSEHQLGLAIDIFAATTAGQFLSKAKFKQYYDRLALNAHRYGRHNTYQKWVAIDTYQPEPRHWRYVGRELATELFDSKMTLAEWYNSHTGSWNIQK